MTKSLLVGLTALVLGLSSCASLPTRYSDETGKTLSTHSEQVDYARWCTDNGYWNEAVRYLEKAETEAVSEEERFKLRQELAENYLSMAEWEYFIAGRSGDQLITAKSNCFEARENLFSVPVEFRANNYGSLSSGVDFACDRIEGSSSPSLR